MDLFSIETALLVGTLIALLWYRLRYKWQYHARYNLPSLKPSLLGFGNATRVFPRNASKMFQVDNEIKKEMGPVWGFYSMTMPMIMVHDPEILKQIMIKEHAVFPDRLDRFLKVNGKAMNESVLNVTGERWKRQRSTMTPTFSSAKLREMAGIVETCVDDCYNILDKHIESSDGSFSVKETFSSLTLDIALSAAFSTKFHSEGSDVQSEAAKQAKKLLDTSFMGFYSFCIAMIPFAETLVEFFDYPMFPKAQLQYFTDLLRTVIKNREAEGNTKRRVDLLQLLLDSKVSGDKVKEGSYKGMTELEIMGNSILVLIAGYDNTANTIGNFVYNMACHPEDQMKVQEEIDEMMETHGKFDYEGLNSLKYLDMCLNETLRLYMPILRNQRVCVKETTINGYTFPKGVTAVIPNYALAHDPDYWEEPFEFRPERMRDMSQIDPMVFQPFGAGPRNCIAMRFALLEVKMAVAKLLYKYDIKQASDTPKPPLKVIFKIAVCAAEPYHLRAEPRKAVSSNYKH